MNSTIGRIVKMYEEMSLSIEDISKEEGLPAEEIKIILNNYSSSFREALKGDQKSALDFTPDEQLNAKQTLFRIMQSYEEENPELAAKIARYIRDDGKGRKDIALQQFKGIQMNVVQFNMDLVKSRASRERTVKIKETKVIDLPVEVTK